MKNLRIFALLLALCLLLGCTPAPEPIPDPIPDPPAHNNPIPEPDPQPEPAPEPFLSAEEFPRMDGSTANLPLMAAVLSAATGIPLEEAQKQVDCSTTANAWYNLAYGYTDILLVYEAAEDTKKLLEDSGTELEIVPIGLDALVFIVNEQNPVTSLTQQQLQQIYTGQITNWSDLGGENLPIKAFQRDPTSGSQSLFRKLLLPDTEPMDAPTELRPGEMGDLIEGIASYNNEGSAIGYSVFYYASYMYAKPGLRFVAVDGIVPSDETIADRTYPLLNPFYVAIRADERSDSPARILRDWLVNHGADVISQAGYIPAK
jgi:phosphate transport system substrate-binding protein